MEKEGFIIKQGDSRSSRYVLANGPSSQAKYKAYFTGDWSPLTVQSEVVILPFFEQNLMSQVTKSNQ